MLDETSLDCSLWDIDRGCIYWVIGIYYFVE